MQQLALLLQLSQEKQQQLTLHLAEQENQHPAQLQMILQLQQDHVVRLETRPPSIEGTGAITQRELVRNALRMRPDRIIVGEVRGAECFDMLQAMNTGHDGSMTTVHANTVRDALSRLEQMVTMIGSDIPMVTIRSQIASSIDIIVQLSRHSDGGRRVMSIAEVNGMEGDVTTMQEIFTFQQRGKSDTGEVLGELVYTGIRPQFRRFHVSRNNHP